MNFPWRILYGRNTGYQLVDLKQSLSSMYLYVVHFLGVPKVLKAPLINLYNDVPPNVGYSCPMGVFPLEPRRNLNLTCYLNVFNLDLIVRKTRWTPDFIPWLEQLKNINIIRRMISQRSHCRNFTASYGILIF